MRSASADWAVHFLLQDSLATSKVCLSALTASAASEVHGKHRSLEGPRHGIVF